jgi:hypothetical protein
MKDTATGGKSYTPLLRQVAEHVFNHREHELTDLKKLSFSLKGLLKKGFRYGTVHRAVTHRSAASSAFTRSRAPRTTRT